MFTLFTQPANMALLQSIGKLFVISFLGYAAVRLRLLTGQGVACLSKFVIAIALPCLIIATLGNELQYTLLPRMGLALIAALGLNLCGLAIAGGLGRFFVRGDRTGYRLFLSLASLQNSGYLPIPLVTAVLPESLQADALLFVFVYMLVMGFIFWSLGVMLIGRSTGPSDIRQNLQKMANPPILATMASLLFLLPPVKSGFDALPLLRETLNTVGGTTIPLVLIVLGGTFAEKLPPLRQRKSLLVASCAIKMLLIPALTFLTLLFIRPEPVFGFVLMLQSAMPAALNHVVVAREYGGEVHLTSRALFLQYFLSLVTVPFFLILFNLLFPFRTV